MIGPNCAAYVGMGMGSFTGAWRPTREGISKETQLTQIISMSSLSSVKMQISEDSPSMCIDTDCLYEVISIFTGTDYL